MNVFRILLISSPVFSIGIHISGRSFEGDKQRKFSVAPKKLSSSSQTKLTEDARRQLLKSKVKKILASDFAARQSVPAPLPPDTIGQHQADFAQQSSSNSRPWPVDKRIPVCRRPLVEGGCDLKRTQDPVADRTKNTDAGRLARSAPKTNIVTDAKTPMVPDVVRSSKEVSTLFGAIKSCLNFVAKDIDKFFLTTDSKSNLRSHEVYLKCGCRYIGRCDFRKPLDLRGRIHDDNLPKFHCGTMYFCNGSIYYGGFKNQQFDGLGQLVCCSGTVPSQSGVWKNGQFSHSAKWHPLDRIE